MITEGRWGVTGGGWMWERELETFSFHSTISEDGLVALGSFSYFLELITFSANTTSVPTNPSGPGCSLHHRAGEVPGQQLPHAQGSSSTFHLSFWPVLLSVILYTAFLDPPRCPQSISLAWAGSCVLYSMKKPVAS